MAKYQTEFGSIHKFRKGGVTVIDDDPKKYVFSNMFEVAAKAKPYERTAVAKNFEYVIESVRAEGTSDWYTAAHDEFVISMDGQVEGRIVLRQGHMALLPVGAAYRFHADQVCTLMIQTIDGPETVHRWAEICQH